MLALENAVRSNTNGTPLAEPTQEMIQDALKKMQFQCVSSLIFLTHPIVLEELHKITGAHILRIQTEKNETLWEKGQPNNLTDVSLQGFVITMDKQFDIDKLSSKINGGNYHASIVDIIRVGGTVPSRGTVPSGQNVPSGVPHKPPVVPAKAPPKIIHGRMYQIKKSQSTAAEHAPGSFSIKKDEHGNQYADVFIPEKGHHRVYGSEEVIREKMKKHLSSHVKKGLTIGQRQLIEEIRNLKAKFDLSTDDDKKEELNQKIRVKMEELRKVIQAEYKIKNMTT